MFQISAIPCQNLSLFLKSYWTDNLTRLLKLLKEKRWALRNSGRNRPGVTFEQYKNEKRDYRRSHRECVKQNLAAEHLEIDKTAELHCDQFWRIVNRRCKGASSVAGPEINFNGVIYRDKASVTKQ